MKGFIKSHRLLAGIPLVIIWILGLVCATNEIFTWWGILSMIISVIISTIGWIYILRPTSN
jgi:hypothetical protein